MTEAFVVHPLPRAVFRLTGAKPLAYLHDVLAQDVADLAPGRGALAVALSPKGRVSAELRVLPLPDGDVLIDADPEARAGVEERVGRHAGLAGVGLLDETDRWTIAAVRGPEADVALERAALETPSRREAAFLNVGEVLVVRVMWGVAGFDLLGPREAVERWVASVDVPTATIEALEAARISAGRPRFGPDVNGDLLVNETPLLRHALALDKGCYPGQESVARVHNLGGVRRVLRGLRTSDGATIEPGADVTHDAASVGRVTSAAGRAAIALLRADIEPGATVAIGHAEATVEELP